LLSVAGAACAALLAAGPAGAATLRFDRVLPGTFTTSECPAEALVSARCFLVEIGGLVPGLGQTIVRERVLQSGEEDADFCEPQIRYGTIVAPRGTIEYIATGIDCPASRELTGGYRAVVARWHAVRGTGLYVGVTGGGNESVRPDADAVFIHLFGTLDVPGVEFDTTAPSLSRVAPMSVRSARPVVVRYALPVARDAVDGAVQVRCTPPSGTRFAVGRTVVRCDAVDRSGNTATTRFAVVVGPRSGR
jgi:hypothetical protein